MIKARRQTHFYMITALCCVLPIVAIAAIIARPSIPIVEEDTLFRLADFADIEQAETQQTFEPVTIKEVEIFAKIVEQNGQSYLQLIPQRPLPFADILVYWNPENGSQETIADDAVLLGQLAGGSPRQFKLPSGLLETSPELLFFSRAQSEFIGTAVLKTPSQ